MEIFFYFQTNKNVTNSTSAKYKKQSQKQSEGYMYNSILTFKCEKWIGNTIHMSEINAFEIQEQIPEIAKE